MSIACALAEAHHHSAPKVGAEQHYAPRRQKTTSAGARPGVLKDPAPQGAVTVGYVAAPEPLLSTPSLAESAAEAVDARTVKFLFQKTLARKKEEEEEERRKEVAKQQEEKYEAKMKLLNDRVRHDLPLTEVEWAAWRQWMGLVPSSSSSARRTKRKKRRKKKLPRGRARRRQRQRPLCGALIVDSDRGMCRAGFPSSCCVPFGCRQGQMLGIMAGMTRRAGFSPRPLASGSHLFAVLFGSTVDTCYVSLQRLLWVELFVFSEMLGSTVALRDDFLELFVFSEMLGSTVALRDDFLELFELSALLGSTVVLGDDFLELVVLSAMLGSTVALGDDFVAMVVFSAMLGSTLDTWCCQSTWPFVRCSS